MKDDPKQLDSPQKKGEGETPPKPWDRLIDENHRWYSRFHVYLMCGPERAMLQAYRVWWEQKYQTRCPRTGAPQDWNEASKRYQWQARAEAWDEAERERIRKFWQYRMDEFRNKQWALALKVHDKLEAMLAHPLTKRVVAGDNGEQITIEPVNWALNDVSRLTDTFTDLGKEALGQDTSDKVKVEIQQPMLDHAASYAWMSEFVKKKNGGNLPQQ